MKKLILNGVISRIDYCNSIYYGLPNMKLHRLQMIMNRSVRILEGLSPRQRITPALIRLHWLPIKARVIYKICLLAQQALLEGEPEYLNSKLEVMQPVNNINTRRANLGYLVEPRFQSNLGARAFSVAAPRLLNRLPVELRSLEDIKCFKKRLKTFLFEDCYCLETESINDDYKCFYLRNGTY